MVCMVCRPMLDEVQSQGNFVLVDVHAFRDRKAILRMPIGDESKKVLWCAGLI